MEKSENTSLNPEEWSTWVKLTKRIRFINGKIPEEAFFAWCENFYTIPIEFMGFRKRNEELEILLIYRKDKYYDGYHTPGTILVPGQKIEAAFQSLLRRELGGNVSIDSPQFIRHFEFLKGSGTEESPRGHEIKMIFAGIVKGEPKEGEWFSKENLPANLLPEFRFLVPDMLDWAEKNLSDKIG